MEIVQDTNEGRKNIYNALKNQRKKIRIKLKVIKKIFN